MQQPQFAAAANDYRNSTSNWVTIVLSPWLLLLVYVATGLEVHDSTEDTRLNTTTLYPVTNKTININRNHRDYTDAQQKNITTEGRKPNENMTVKEKNEVEAKTERVTAWKIDANYAQPKDKSQAIYTQSRDKLSEVISAKPKDKESVDVYSQPKDKKSEDSNSTDSKEQFSVENNKNNHEENQFKPSPHLGSFIDDDNLKVWKFSTPEPSDFTAKKPGIDFFGSKDFYAFNYKSPKDTYQEQLVPPYRFGSAHFLTTNNWKQTLESKPTVESFVKIPAGGLYKHSNSFKEKPNSYTDDDNFGIGYNEEGREKENPVKKRSNPWKNLVQLVTAFLPVGLIISALTPNIITLHSADNDPYLSRLSRRADSHFAGVPAISERCRRRLLCELHSEENYVRAEDKWRYVRKHCYKIRCEEPHALRAVLRWLLAHGPPRERHADVMDHHHRSDDCT